MTQQNGEFTFVPAERTQRKARVALIGQAGSGKTMSALLIAKGLTSTDQQPRIAVIDTEHGSASLYSDVAKFDTLRLTPPYSPARYRAACEAAVKAGYDVLVIDSMSHEWSGEGGILETVDQRKLSNQFTAWNGPSQDHEAFIQFVAALPVHVITTFRSKMAYAMSTENGKTKVEKLGLEAITRGNAEYELDLVLEMTQDHRGVVTKSRVSKFADRTILKPGEKEGRELFDWLNSAPPPPVPPPAPEETAVQRVQGLILAALQTPEDSAERGRLANAKAVLALAGYDHVTVGVIAKLTAAQLEVVERALVGEAAPAPAAEREVAAATA